MTKCSTLAVISSMVFLWVCGVAGAHNAVPHVVPHAATAGPRCGTSHRHVRTKHVVWIFLENTDYRAVIGNPQAPYVNRLAKNCRLATNYHGLANPSLPNYMGATSGQTQFHSDCQPLVCSSKLNSIFNKVGSWRDYQGGMKRPCQKVAGSLYEPEHNPAVYYDKLALRCHSRDLPLSQFHLGAARFEFVAPNSTVQDQLGTRGDAWLARWLPHHIFNQRSYRNGSTRVFLTWDESYKPGNHVVMIKISPRSHGHITRRLTHLWLLSTTKKLLGL